MRGIEQTTSARDALALAIAIERHNGQRLRELAHRFRVYDAEASRFLESLAREEDEHEAELLKLFAQLFGGEVPPCSPIALMHYLSGLLVKPRHFFVINPDMAETLLQMALHMERYTQQFYQNLAAATSEPQSRAMYARLAAFEGEHERAFHRRLAAAHAQPAKSQNATTRPCPN